MSRFLEQIPFGQILNHKEAFFELVLKRQNALLRATGLKLFSHFGVLPSGEILSDGGLDNYLSEQMFDEEFEFTMADASSVGASTLRCSLGKGEFRPFGIGKPVYLESAAPVHRVMRKMNTFNLGDHLQQVVDFGPNFPEEKSHISSKASLPKGDQENSMSLFAQEDGQDCSPFRMRGFEEQGLFTGTTATQSNRSIPNSSNPNRLSPNKKELRFLGINKIEKQPSVIKEEDPVDSQSAHQSSNGGAGTKPHGSSHEPQFTSEASKRSNSKTEQLASGGVITDLHQIGKVSEAKLFSDQSIRLKSKNSQTNEACRNPTVEEESQQKHFDSLANNDSEMNHSSIPHIRLSNTMSDSSRFAIKHDESVVNCADLDQAEGIELVLGCQMHLEPEAGADTPVAGDGAHPDGDYLENFSRFRSEKTPQNPQSHFEKQRSTENPEQSDRLAKNSKPLFESRVGFNRHIQSEIDEIESKIQLYKLREKQLDETLKANQLSAVALRSPDHVESEWLLDSGGPKPSEFGAPNRRDDQRRPLPTILKTEDFNLIFGSMHSRDTAEARDSQDPNSTARQKPQDPSPKPLQTAANPLLQTPLSKIERITTELRNSIKRHSLNKTATFNSDILKTEKSERVNLNNLTKIQPPKHLEPKQATQSHSKTEDSKPQSPANLQAHTKKSANSSKAPDFFKPSSHPGKLTSTPTSKKAKPQEIFLKSAIAFKLENSSTSHVPKHTPFVPARALASNLIKSSHEIEVKKFNPQQSVPEAEEAREARQCTRDRKKLEPKSKTVFRRENSSSEQKTSSQVFLYSSVNNPLKKLAKDLKLTQSSHHNNSSITSKLLKSAIDLKTEKASVGIDFTAAKRSRQSVEPDSPANLHKSTQPAPHKLASSVAGIHKPALPNKATFTSALTHELSRTLQSTVPGVSEKMLQAVHKKYTANQIIKKASADYTASTKRPHKLQ